MMITRLRLLITAGLSSTLVLAASASRAGGPLEIVSPGVPYVWPNGGFNITWNPDQGPLGPFSNAEALSRVESAFGAWQDVPTASATYVTGASLPEDVDVTNYGTYLAADAPDGLSAVVFDADGTIFDELFGPDSGVLGFAGPEWLDPDAGTILEGIAFINGGAILANPDPVELAGTLIHEFGHWNNLAHSQVNGSLFLAQILLDPDFEHSGPRPNNFFPLVDLTGQVETMYPFSMPGSGAEVLKADDIAAFSRLYPTPTFAASTGAIQGAVLAPNAAPLAGVNVIARNVDDPFGDAVAGLSGELTRDTKEPAFLGDYTLPGLSPGAEYVIYVDEIATGEFNPPALVPLPGPEEFFNGAAESSNASTDDPQAFTPVIVAAGEARTGVNVTLNRRAPGPIVLDDDEAIELFLPFSFTFCGVDYNSVFVSSNGNLTFESPDSSFDAHPRAHLNGMPRIAPLWADLVPNVGGTVAFSETEESLTVSWSNVPEYPDVGANTFNVTLHGGQAQGFSLDYGDVSAEVALAGFSCGGRTVSGFEVERDLSSLVGTMVNSNGVSATYEWFSDADHDLAGESLSFTSPTPRNDAFEPNDSIAQARTVTLPFSTVNSSTRYSDLEVGDVDFYRFRANAGQHLLIETALGPVADTLIGIFNTSGTPLATDDDGLEFAGPSQILFQVPTTADYIVGVTTFPDVGFEGAGEDFGRYTLSIRAFRGTPLMSVPFPGTQLGDDDYGRVDFSGFSFPFQGTPYSSVFVSSNGNLTFGTPPSDPLNDVNDFDPNVTDFLAGPPRVAPLWRDFTPVDPTTLERKGVVLVETLSDGVSIHFVALREFSLGGTNTATVTLNRTGRVVLNYGPTNREYAVAGFTQGGGATDPGPIDLSQATGLRVSGTRYEEFSFDLSTFGGDDLSFAGLTFDPALAQNPCASLCSNPQQISWSGSYQGQQLGTGAICREARQPVVGGNCGNFASGRRLTVNGVQMPCNNLNWSSVPPARNGGYCIQTTAGDFPWAFVTLW